MCPRRVTESRQSRHRGLVSSDMNESILYTLAEVAVTLAGFSGLVVVFRVRGAEAWSTTELRILWFLIGDSLLVLFFALLPFPLALAEWAADTVWGVCNLLLGSWFFIGNLLIIRGERRDRLGGAGISLPVITPLFRLSVLIAFLMSVILWLGAFDIAIPRGQAIYVLGLIVLLAFAAVEFLFFIALMSQGASRK